MIVKGRMDRMHPDRTGAAAGFTAPAAVSTPRRRIGASPCRGPAGIGRPDRAPPAGRGRRPGHPGRARVTPFTAGTGRPRCNGTRFIGPLPFR